MSTENKKKHGRLSHEILWLFAICFVISLILYFILAFCTVAVVEGYCWERDIPLDEDQLYHLDSMAFSMSLAVSVIFFVILFLALFGEKLAYINTIIKGVDTLRGGEFGHLLPVEGNNELTQLAKAVNSTSSRPLRPLMFIYNMFAATFCAYSATWLSSPPAASRRR